MKNIKDTLNDKAFLFKAVALILCVMGVVIWACATTKFASLGGYPKVSMYEQTMWVATASYVIILGILVIIYIIEESDNVFEILFLFAGAAVNLVAGIIALVVAIKYDGNWVPLILGVLMIATGVIMIFDLIRAIKS